MIEGRLMRANTCEFVENFETALEPSPPLFLESKIIADFLGHIDFYAFGTLSLSNKASRNTFKDFFFCVSE